MIYEKRSQHVFQSLEGYGDQLIGSSWVNPRNQRDHKYRYEFVLRDPDGNTLNPVTVTMDRITHSEMNLQHHYMLNLTGKFFKIVRNTLFVDLSEYMSVENNNIFDTIKHHKQIRLKNSIRKLILLFSDIYRFSDEEILAQIQLVINNISKLGITVYTRYEQLNVEEELSNSILRMIIEPLSEMRAAIVADVRGES